MSSYETDVHHTTNKDDYCHNSEVISSNIEHITAILHVVSRWERLLQISMICPVNRLYIFNPFIQWPGCISMRLNEVI